MSNKIVGIFMSIGAIMLFALFAGLWPAGQTDPGIENAKLLAENNLTIAFLFMGGLSFGMMQTGAFIITERLIKKADSTYKTLLAFSKLAFAASLTMFIVSGSLWQSSGWLYSTGDKMTAGVINHMAAATTSLLPWIWGSGLIILGLAAISGSSKPKNMMDWTKGLLIISGIVFVLTPFIGASGAGTLGFVSWGLACLTHVIIGALLVTEKIDF